MDADKRADIIRNARELLQSDQPLDALTALETLPADGRDVESVTLRLEALAALAGKTHWHADKISEALGWLQAEQPQVYGAPEVWAMFQPALTATVDRHLAQIDNRKELPPFKEVDALLELAPHFPALECLGALVETQIVIAQRHKDRDGDRYARMRRAIDVYRLERNNRQQKPRIDTAATLDKVSERLREVFVRLAPQDALRGVVARTLGEVWDEADDAIRAFDWYTKASRYGLDCAAILESLQAKALPQVQKALHTRLDQLLAGGHLRETSALLECLEPLDSSAALRIRRADWAFLSGDLIGADLAYQAAAEMLVAARSDETGVLPRDLDALRAALDSAPVVMNASESAASDREAVPYATFGLAADDLRSRAAVGRILISQRQERIDDARALIQGLLKTGGLPDSSLKAILNAFSDNELRIATTRADSLRAEARLSAEAGDWARAASLYFDLSCLPGAGPDDLARLALAMHQAGQPLEAVAYYLAQVGPAELAMLPAEQRETLLNALADAGRWSLADRLAAVMASAPTAYRARRDAYVEAQLAVGVQAIDQRRYADAEAAMTGILALIPTHPSARLILGRVYVATARLSDARRVLEPLTGDPLAGRGASLALAEVDLATGRMQDAHDRLDRLNGASNAADDALAGMLRQAVTNRLAGIPAVICEPFESRVAADTLRRSPANGWAAFFAVKVSSVRAARSALPVRDRCAELLMAISQHATTGAETNFAWRYVGHNGRLIMALMCRVEAASQPAAEAAAHALWELMRPLLPLAGLALLYEPVYSAAELAFLRAPVAVESAVEIARKEIMVHGHGPQDEMYMVYPLPAHDDSLGRMLSALADQSVPTVLDIHFKPTEVLQWERGIISRMIQKQNQNGGLMALPDLQETVKHEDGAGTPDFRLNMIRQMYPFFLDRTQSLAFIVQIQIAAQGRMDAALPNLVSLSLFGTSRYEIVPALAERDVETVRRNIYEIAPERWVFSDAPDGLERWRHLLTPDEALSATRIPHPGPGGLPGLPALKIRTVAPPDQLPRSGIVIGESLTTDQGRPSLVKLTMHDRTRHVYVVGRTGSGKSTLLLNMALQDIDAGRGVGIIDPHGDLIRFLLERIPAHRTQDVVLFDPADLERPVAFNIMDVEDMFEGNMVIADFLGLMRRMFDPYDQGIVGPRFENIIRNSMLALMEAMPGSTLIDVVRFLSDKPYREKVIESVTDPVVLNYWNNIGKELDKFGWGSAKGEILDWLTSKFGRFVDDKMVRNIIGQGRNTINFRDIMDTGKILLVDLSKGRVGYQNSQFLGLLLVPRLLVAALGRARLSQSERRPFYLYVDEFQSFVTPAFAEMLSEARKFGVSLTVANQFISQLTNEIREAVFGNVGNFFVFQVGIKDGHFLTPEMYPAELDDLVNLPNYHMLAKVLIDGNATPPFPVRTLADSRAPNPALAEKMREYSRQRYGRDVFIVTQEIQQRFSKLPEKDKKPERTSLFDL